MFLPLANFESPLAWIVIAMVCLLIFGGRLPSLARSLGTSVSEFKKGVREGEAEEPPKTGATPPPAATTEKK